MSFLTKLPAELHNPDAFKQFSGGSVTGHSLGGAPAALIANRIGTELQADVDAVYTFGMPRPGNKAFADLYNQQLGMRTYRLGHGAEIVPSAAAPSVWFRHLGVVLSFDRLGWVEKARLA